MEANQTGSAIPKVLMLDLDILIPFCLLESPRSPVAILLMEEGPTERWRRSRLPRTGYPEIRPRRGLGLLAVKSSSHVINIFGSSRQEWEVGSS